METVQRNIAAESRTAQVLVIWTDCDREGENIGSEIISVCLAGNPRLMVLRARFSVIQPRCVFFFIDFLSGLYYYQKRSPGVYFALGEKTSLHCCLPQTTADLPNSLNLPEKYIKQ